MACLHRLEEVLLEELEDNGGSTGSCNCRRGGRELMASSVSLNVAGVHISFVYRSIRGTVSFFDEWSEPQPPPRRPDRQAPRSPVPARTQMDCSSHDVVLRIIA